MAHRPNAVADDDVNREERFDIRLSVAEAAALRKAAAAAGQRRTTYIRAVLFGMSRSTNQVSRADLQQLIRALTPIGTNLMGSLKPRKAVGVQDPLYAKAIVLRYPSDICRVQEGCAGGVELGDEGVLGPTYGCFVRPCGGGEAR